MPTKEEQMAEQIGNLGEMDRLKKEIEQREADILAMDSEKERKADVKATYRRYMRQADGNNRIWTMIAAGLSIILVAVLGYGLVDSVRGDMDSSMWVVVGVICAACLFGILAIAFRDWTKRSKEAKMRLSSHKHRYDTQLKLRRIELDELKEKLAALESGNGAK